MVVVEFESADAKPACHAAHAPSGAVPALHHDPRPRRRLPLSAPTTISMQRHRLAHHGRRGKRGLSDCFLPSFKFFCCAFQMRTWCRRQTTGSLFFRAKTVSIYRSYLLAPSKIFLWALGKRHRGEDAIKTQGLEGDYEGLPFRWGWGWG